MSRILGLGMLLTLALALLLAPSAAHAQGAYPLDKCRSGAFSTEEDFMMKEGKPYDGDPYISDGDLLSTTGDVCARNADLLMAFNPTGGYMPDLGLDAVHIISFDKRLVAFSTEIDDIFNRFSAGDVLFTDGGRIPNSALVAKFGIRNNIGLDGLQFIGKPEDLIAFANRVREADPAGWDKGLLDQLLRAFSVDIWFSIEGTHNGLEGALILDGDLLAASGSIVARNSDLLPASVPAGLPARGVDYGLDAIAAPELPGRDSPLLFSTEILHRGEPAFNDGDVLKKGDGVVIHNEDLIAPFRPFADFLGLDALWIPFDQPPPRDPNLQTMCGDTHSNVDFDGGMVAVGGPGTGLYRDNPGGGWPDGRPRRPCGAFVPVDGYLPSIGVDRFRVAYRPAGAPAPAVGAATGIRTTWKLFEWRWWPVPGCYLGPSLSTDASGWMDASDYLAAKNGTLTGCANSGLRLAVWNTDNTAGFDPGPADENGHYVLWLEWDDGALHREPFEHHLQLDNILPTIAPYPAGLQVRLPGGGVALPACNLDNPARGSTYEVWGQFDDAYYWKFSLALRGGDPPASVSYGPHNYWDANDGTAPIKNTDLTGTTPDLTTVHLRDINMTDLGASFKKCCYVLDLYVHDAAIRHSFNFQAANDNSGSYYAWTFVTFAATP